MNILLIRPPDPLQHAGILSHTRPMNLAYLASYLRGRGFAVRIIDYEAETFTQDSYSRLLKEFEPAVVGVSCVTPTIINGAKLCSLAKCVDSRIVTVVGGAHASGLPERTMEEFPFLDCLVFGEGEVTFGELCELVRAGEQKYPIAGLVFRDRGRIVRNKPRELLSDLDTLPFPARDLIDYRVQAGHSSRGFTNRILSTELFTSRGCPIGCSFCAIQTTFGKNVRFRNLSFVEEEIRQIVRDHRFSHLVIADDTFTLRKERAFQLCEIIGRSGIASWNCDTRVNTVSKELLREMSASGCRKVAFGVESGSQRVLDAVGKKITVEQVRDAVQWAREAGIRDIEGNFMIGSDPSETRDEVEMTRKLIRSLPWTFVSVSIIVPYPGTPVADRMAKAGMVPTEISWEDYVMIGIRPKWRTTHFSSDDLVRHQRRLSRDFYLDPRYIAGRLLSIRTWSELRYWVSAGTAYVRWHFTGKL